MPDSRPVSYELVKLNLPGNVSTVPSFYLKFSPCGSGPNHLMNSRGIQHVASCGCHARKLQATESHPMGHLFLIHSQFWPQIPQYNSLSEKEQMGFVPDISSRQ